MEMLIMCGGFFILLSFFVFNKEEKFKNEKKNNEKNNLIDSDGKLDIDGFIKRSIKEQLDNPKQK